VKGDTSGVPRQWAREIPVRDDVRTVSRFPATDYADSFEISVTTGTRTPEQWARAVFEDAPAAMRLFLTGGWRALGLRLGPPRSARHVLGWRIAAARPDAAVLEARSAMGITARLVLQAGASSLLFATFVRSDGLAGRVAWSAVAPLHRLIVPRLLAGAARRASQA
jgi:hypothetical protein